MSDKDRSTAAAELVDAMRRDAPRVARPRASRAAEPPSEPPRELRVEDERLPWGTVDLVIDDRALAEMRLEAWREAEEKRKREAQAHRRRMRDIERASAAKDEPLLSTPNPTSEER